MSLWDVFNSCIFSRRREAKKRQKNIDVIFNSCIFLRRREEKMKEKKKKVHRSHVGNSPPPHTYPLERLWWTTLNAAVKNDIWPLEEPACALRQECKLLSLVDACVAWANNLFIFAFIEKLNKLSPQFDNEKKNHERNR